MIFQKKIKIFYYKKKYNCEIIIHYINNNKMELNFSNFSLLESIIYRANIFNYDIKFLTCLREKHMSFNLNYYSKL